MSVSELDSPKEPILTQQFFIVGKAMSGREILPPVKKS